MKKIILIHTFTTFVSEYVSTRTMTKTTEITAEINKRNILTVIPKNEKYNK